MWQSVNDNKCVAHCDLGRVISFACLCKVKIVFVPERTEYKLLKICQACRHVQLSLVGKLMQVNDTKTCFTAGIAFAIGDNNK